MAKGTISMLSGTNPIDETQRVQTEVGNLNKRLLSVGVQPEVSSPGPLINLLRLLTRPGSASLSALREYTNPSAGPTPGVLDPGAAFMRGLTGKQTTFGKDIARDLGASDKPWFKTSVLGVKIAPNTAGVLGTAMDLLNPTDPLNWILPGAGKVGSTAVVKGMPLLEKAFGTQAAGELAEKLGTEWVNKHLGRISQAGNPSITTAGQLVGALGKRATDRGIPQGVNPEAISDIMLKALEDNGLNASSRLIPKDKYSLKMGIQAPIINKKLAEFNIPGTQLLATGLARGGEKLMNTELGQAIGKNFAEPGTFVPNTVPGSVWTRMVKSSAPDKPQVKIGDIIPDPTRLELQSGPEAYKTIMEDLKTTAANATRREQDFETTLDQVLKDTTDADRKELMKGLVDPTHVVADHLKQPLAFLDATRKKIVEDYKKMGVTFTPLEDYVPFIATGKPLTKDEAAMLKGIFGARLRRVQGNDLAQIIGANADPHLISRTFAAVDPSEVNKVLGRKYLTEDAGVAMARRGVKAIRGQEATVFLQDMIQKYGLTIEDIENLKHLPDGYVAVMPRVDSAGRVALDPVQKMEGQAFAVPQEFVNAYNEYTNLMYNPHKSNGLLKAFDQATRAYKTVAYMWNPGHIPRDFMSNVYNLWLGGMRSPGSFIDAARVLLDVGKDSKAGALRNEFTELLPQELALENIPNSIAKTLGTETDVPELIKKAENLIYQEGNTSISMLEKKLGIGTTDAKRLLTDLERRGVIGPADKLGKNPILNPDWQPPTTTAPDTSALSTGGRIDTPMWQGTTVELYDEVRKLGLTESGGVLNEFMQAGKDWSINMGGGPLGKYTDIMRWATRTNDNLARIAGVIDNLKKGMTLEQSVMAVKKVLFDYNALTPFEKQFMKRVVPFYTWMRKNIPLQVEMMFKQPGKFATTYKAMQDIGVPEDDTVPSFVTQSGGLEVEGKSGQKKEVLPSLPFVDLNKIPLSVKQMRELLGSVNPVIRVLPEIATNTAFFSGQPLENYRGELQTMPFGAQLEKLGLFEKGKAPKIPKRTLGYILNQIPPLRNLDVITNPDNPRQGAKLTSILGGPQIYPEKWAREAATYEQREKLRALLRVLEDKGIEVPTTRELEALTKVGTTSKKSKKGSISMLK